MILGWFEVEPGWGNRFDYWGHDGEDLHDDVGDITKWPLQEPSE